VFGKVDTEAQQELAGSFGISSIPTLMVIRDGVVLYAQPAALPEAALEQLISRAPRAGHGQGPCQHRRTRRARPPRDP
jgi:thioredoxin-like negative regulator of GroEL